MEVMEHAGANDEMQQMETPESLALQVLASLTQRRMQLVDHLMEGLSTAETAARMQISIKTVELHRANVCRELGVTRSVEAVALISRARMAELRAENRELRQSLGDLHAELDQLRAIVDALAKIKDSRKAEAEGGNG